MSEASWSWNCEAYSGCPCPDCIRDEDVPEALQHFIDRAEKLGHISVTRNPAIILVARSDLENVLAHCDPMPGIDFDAYGRLSTLVQVTAPSTGSTS